jgi:peptide chain release factor
MESKIIQITSGQGPAECEWVIGKLLSVFLKECEKENIEYDIIQTVDGYNIGDYYSVTVKISNYTLDFIKRWNGSIQWIGKSMYRENHKRKNWFVGIKVFDISKSVIFDESKIEFNTMRSSGAGGQHVNKTESAVRAIYKPLGISVVASDTRNQHQNKKLAIDRLKMMVSMIDDNIVDKQVKTEWLSHRELERGNPVLIFVGDKFKVK